MKPSIYLETFGCQMNVADSERALTRIREAGFDLAASPESSDIVIFNTCSVRERAEKKVFSRIGEVKKGRSGKDPLIGVMGCVAQLEGKSLFNHSTKIDFIIGTRATDRIPSILERALNGQKGIVDLGERLEGESWGVSAEFRHSPYVAFVPIIEGCNKFCTYCIVPYSRGREISRLADEIIREVLRLRTEGYLEIHLIGQNVNSYRPRTEEGLKDFPGATPFSRLLRAVAATGIERIKFTTSFPRDFHPDIVTAIEENENLCDWVHLPVQSGSNSVLHAMRRGYKIEDYLERIRRIKCAKRRISLTSDIIVGFPGESEEDFKCTMSLVEICQYDSLYIFKYSERPGTPAAKLINSVTEQEKTARFLALERLQYEIQSSVLAGYIGREVKVLVEGESARSQKDMTGHSTCQKVVNFACDKSLKGQEVLVRITEVKMNSLYGELCH